MDHAIPPSQALTMRTPTSTRSFVAVAVVVLLAACRAGRDKASDATAWQYTPDVEITETPFDDVHANWKERLDQAYVYRELRGSYTETGRLLPQLFEDAKRAGLTITGPPFALFYDDPGTTAVIELRSRACLPVASVDAAASISADTLPSATVAYAVVRGPYPEVPRAYRGLLEYMRRFGWVEAGPIREIYLVSPTSVPSYDALLCEIQIPVRVAQ